MRFCLPIIRKSEFILTTALYIPHKSSEHFVRLVLKDAGFCIGIRGYCHIDSPSLSLISLYDILSSKRYVVHITEWNICVTEFILNIDK